jgi:recombination protein RecT
MSATTHERAPTRSSVRSLASCSNLQQAFAHPELRERIGASLPKHLNPDRMLRSFVQAANKNPDIYRCQWQSVVGVFLSLSQLGLEPNSPLGHAYLIPFKTSLYNPETRKRDIETYDLQLVLGYGGFAELLWRSGMVANIHAGVVLPGDDFALEYGTNDRLAHIPRGKASPQDTPLWAYAHVQLILPHGAKGQSFDAMPWSEALEIRNASQAYQAALASLERAKREGWKTVPKSYSEAPWVRWERPMGAKTAFRRLCKYLRKTPELAYAVDIDERQESGNIDWTKALSNNDPNGNVLAELTYEERMPNPFDTEFHAAEPEPMTVGASQGVPPSEPQQRSPARSYGRAAPREVEPEPQPQPQPPQPEPEPEPRFEQHLLDQFGEPARTAFSPQAVADYMLERVNRLPVPQSEALIEHNFEALVAAAEADPAVRRQLIDSEVLTIEGGKLDAPEPKPEAPKPDPEAPKPDPEAAQPKPEAAQPKPEAAKPKPAKPAPKTAKPTEQAPLSLEIDEGGFLEDFARRMDATDSLSALAALYKGEIEVLKGLSANGKIRATALYNNRRTALGAAPE